MRMAFYHTCPYTEGEAVLHILKAGKPEIKNLEEACFVSSSSAEEYALYDNIKTAEVPYCITSMSDKALYKTFPKSLRTKFEMDEKVVHQSDASKQVNPGCVIS
jgi:predicted Ser/Thr protein kinase